MSTLWTLFGERIETADMSGTPRVYQPFSVSRNKLIKAFRTWVIYFNTPVFTALYLDIYSNQNGLPCQRLFRSDKSWAPSNISSAAYAAKELWFDFTNPISLRGGETYHAALYASGYTGNSSSHLAWARGIPDPNNTTDISINTKNVGKTPYYLGVIDDLR
jgi:hypothetical protein